MCQNSFLGSLDNSIFHSLPFDIDKNHRRRIPSLNKGFKVKPLNSQFDPKDVRFDNSLAAFRPNSEIIGKVRKMEKFYGHFVQLGK